MKKVLVALMFGMGLVALGAGCDKKDEGAKTDDKAGAAASGDKIGVQECDDYMAKMKACMDKMPAAAKGAQEQAFKTTTDAWKQAASTPAGKDGLKTGCKAALDALAQNPMCK